jgi:hypothetical protein
MTPSGIEPATFRLVAPCLNQLRYRVPQNTDRENRNTGKGGRISQISRQSADEGGKVVRHLLRPLYPQEIFLVIISVRSWVNPRAIGRQAELCQQNIPITLPGIEPATFRLVPQCLNQLRYRVPYNTDKENRNTGK